MSGMTLGPGARDIAGRRGIVESTAAETADRPRVGPLGHYRLYWTSTGHIRRFSTMSENGEFESVRALIWSCSQAGENTGPSRSRSRTLLPRSSSPRLAVRWTLLYGRENDGCILSSGVSRAATETIELQFLVECRRGAGRWLSSVSTMSAGDSAGNARLVWDSGQRVSRYAADRRGRPRPRWVGG